MTFARDFHVMLRPHYFVMFGLMGLGTARLRHMSSIVETIKYNFTGSKQAPREKPESYTIEGTLNPEPYQADCIPVSDTALVPACAWHRPYHLCYLK